MSSGFQAQAARPKGRQVEDAPSQQPMRPAGIRNAPSTDQKKVRRAMSRGVKPKTARIVRSECSGCFEPFVLDTVEMTVEMTRLSNGVRGQGHVPAGPVSVQVVESDGLLMWDCPLCGYAESEEDVEPDYTAARRTAAYAEGDTVLLDGTQEAVYSGAEWLGRPAPEGMIWVEVDGDVVPVRPDQITSIISTSSTTTKESSMNDRDREVQMLQAMAVASLPDQYRIAADLEAMRSQRVASLRAKASLDLSNAVVTAHRTPVPTYSRHTAATDWIAGLDVPEGDPSQTMRTEATVWFGKVSADVRADREEFAVQAQGMARRVASRHGEMAAVAARAFLDQAAHLHRTADGFEGKSQAYQDGWKAGTEDAANGKFNLQNNSRGSDTEYAEGYYGAQNGFTAKPAARRMANEDNGYAESTVTDYEGLAPVTEEPVFDDGWASAGTDDTGVHPVLPSTDQATAAKMGEWMQPIGHERRFSDGCGPEGDGQCDGYVEDSMISCDCTCHVSWETKDLKTVADYARWHKELWDSYEPDNPYRPVKISVKTAAQVPISRIQSGDIFSTSDGKTWMANGGPSRGPLGNVLVSVNEAYQDGEGNWWPRYDGYTVSIGSGPFMLIQAAGDRTAVRRLAAEGQTCANCGAAIERDPEGEENRSWHHNDGDSHDHEAKPSGDAKEGRRTAGDYGKDNRCTQCGAHIAESHEPGCPTDDDPVEPVGKIAEKVTCDECKGKGGACASCGGYGYFVVSSRKTAVSLTNVGIDKDGNGTGTDASGNKMTFRLSDKDRKDLQSVLYSDLAINFTGVDVEQDEIITTGSYRTATLYCPTHKVFVGDGNRAAHTDCKKETRKAKDASHKQAGGMTCDVCGEDDPSVIMFGSPCMPCVKARHAAAMDHRCHCGRKKIPGAEQKPFGEHGRKWIPCERCLGTIQQTGSKTAAQARPLYEIAEEIHRDWKNVYFGAVPYLEAMASLDSMADMYGMDDAESIVLYFLSNATTWRGEKAREIKKELKGMSRYASKRTAADEQTCSVCGDKIAKDPSGEEPSTWHHDNGEKHDHEAKAGGGKESSRDLQRDLDIAERNYALCPDYEGQSFDKSTGACSCGGHHSLADSKGPWPVKARRHMAWTEDGSDITPMAEFIMGLQDEAYIVLGINGFSGPDADVMRRKVIDYIKDKISPKINEITQADLDVVEDYNAHAAYQAVVELQGKTGGSTEARRRTAAEPLGAPDPQNGLAESTLPVVEVGDQGDVAMWPWEQDENTPGTGAADVAGVTTPGGESGYPQPTASKVAYELGDHFTCVKCGTDIEYVGDYRGGSGLVDPGNGWWDRGGNFSCNDGSGFHEPYYSADEVNPRLAASPTICTKCGKTIDTLEVFPGGICLDCYTPIGDALAETMTADDLARMWGWQGAKASRNLRLDAFRARVQAGVRRQAEREGATRIRNELMSGKFQAQVFKNGVWGDVGDAKDTRKEAQSLLDQRQASK